MISRNNENNNSFILMFMHIPKTAGTTFRSILNEIYAPEDSFKYDGNNRKASEERFMDLPRDLMNLSFISNRS
ncbi:MAG: hypothetical protein P9L92_12025 [Candidatus Electryonea clarkiae]|nr:hypothetical protein [Candidatus Electryonea clarkiae]MDP8285978.1 hypothetical protein [Candidatus Electryonea clarkiae]